MSVKNTQLSDKKVFNSNAEREKDRTPVRGVFEFHEVPGGRMEFSYKMHKGEDVLTYKGDTALVDGQIYTLPLGVAKHLNKNGWYPVHSYSQDEDGNKVARIGQKVRRFGFRSLEFMDIEDLSQNGSSLVTVEKV